MTKLVFSLLAFPVFAFANITATGKICSNPTIDPDGYLETSRRDLAERLADKDALKHCYPYQTQRVSEYRYSNTNSDCHSTNPHAIRETVEADYACAGPQ